MREVSWGGSECDEESESAKERKIREARLRERAELQRRKREQEEFERKRCESKEFQQEGKSEIHRVLEHLNIKELKLTDLEQIQEITKEKILEKINSEKSDLKMMENELDQISKIKEVKETILRKERSNFEAITKKLDMTIKARENQQALLEKEKNDIIDLELQRTEIFNEQHEQITRLLQEKNELDCYRNEQEKVTDELNEEKKHLAQLREEKDVLSEEIEIQRILLESNRIELTKIQEEREAASQAKQRLEASLEGEPDEKEETHPETESNDQEHRSEPPILSQRKSASEESESNKSEVESVLEKTAEKPLKNNEYVESENTDKNGVENQEISRAESNEVSEEGSLFSELEEIIKDYIELTGKKVNFGVNIHKNFKDWIRDNFALEKPEKKQLLESCEDYENLVKKEIVSQIIFSDKSIRSIRRYINQKFILSVSANAIKTFAIEQIEEQNYLKRFKHSPRKIKPRQILEIVHKYQEGASERELAKEYNVSQKLIHLHLKRQEVEPHGYADWRKVEIKTPQEFTPDLAKFIALMVTEGAFDKYRIRIKNTSYALIEEFKNLVQRNFQIDNFHEFIENENNPNWKKVYACEIYSLELAEFLRKYIDKSDYQKATLPKEFFDLSAENIGEVLRVAFSADGSVTLRPFKHAKSGRWNIVKQVEFTCFSSSLKKQWSRLIESLGIKCRVYANLITISRKENIVKFKKKVGFMDGISIQKDTYWADHTRQEVLNALIKSYKYPGMVFDSKEQALEFLNSLFKKLSKKQ